ncbi:MULTISPECIES: protein kinase domain-containing protein [unclassified Brevibacterium]|uniref:protein kinase domain-containing protein n=1 Tax=unclassified Brevibacterium TaxID=2614124 RepID=UPI001091F012|nr:PASTA domain-containing protein [Brevibacterium sp. S22]TGD30490.1 serine/threonine-protein kinase [Brevibacterium sp. S22]
MTARRDPLISTVLNDRYRIDAKIARGGMAMVYRGTDLRLDREIAIKVMHEHLISDDTFVERFRREAINAGRLTHPNLVAIHDQARDGDIVYLVMEHLPSVTLRRELKHRGSFTPRQAIVVLDAILAALEAVHSTGIIHRDLKPDNVLLGTDGQVKLADFGLARAVTTATTTKTLIGTVGYVAPELVTRAGADSRTDLYTVGIMFYEMLTGTQPYTDDVPIQVAYRHVHDTVPPPSDVVPRLSPRLDALVLWATSKEPEDRPADAAQFRLALAEARAEMSEAELDLGDPAIAAGEHSPVLTASIDLGEEVPKEKKSRTDEIPYLEGEDDDTGTEAADDDSAHAQSGAAAGAGVAAAAAGIGGVTAAVTSDDDSEDDDSRDTDNDSDDSPDDSGSDAEPTADDSPGSPAESSDDAGTTDRSDDEVGAAAAGAGGAAAGVGAAGVASGSGAGSGSGSGSGGDSADGTGDAAESDDDDKAAVAAFAAPASAKASKTRRRRRRVLASLVAVVAVLALVAWLVIANLPAPTSIVPGQLAGKEVDEVTSQLEDSDLKAEPKEVFDDSVPVGEVIGTEPVSGSELPPDSTVTVVVSKGEEKFAVPELEGMKRAEAEDALKKVSLAVGKVEEEYSDTDAEDTVISASKKPGTKLSKGEKIDLVVSKGVAPTPVPNVEGLTFDAAYATLAKRGFRVGKDEVFSDDVPKGKVVSQFPKSTESKPANSLIIVRVSKGKEKTDDDKKDDKKDEKSKDDDKKKDKKDKKD